MVVFTYTFPVDPPEGRQPVVELDELWDCLVAKAGNPVPFVPAITGAVVRHRFDGGFHREIELRGAARYGERVVLEPKRRIRFEQLDDPVLSVITNEIGGDGPGGLTFTFSAALSAAGVELSRSEPGFLAAQETTFHDTARAELNAIRLTIALARCGAAGWSFHG